ncbi:MAG: glucose-1-phosphate thymidylyltransferase RfbA [Anaerolineales bacterium]|jgi:glucose-1-phosphate thymidylyltransferase
MKGIILAGGKGTRLHPITLAVSKQLLPVYDKPMVYYPLSMLMLAGIREIMLISTPQDLPLFRHLLGSGLQWGLQFSYAEQAEPRGLPEAFIIAEEFLDSGPACLILGDNIFFGQGISNQLIQAARLQEGGIIFAYRVRDPQRYGVVEFDDSWRAISLEEKPASPRSNFAIPGLYFFDSRVASFARTLKPSARLELEITDLGRLYLEMGHLQVLPMGRGIAWLDAGTHESLLQAANFIQAVQERQGIMISSPEEIAYRKGFISREMLIELAQSYNKNGYAEYLLRLAEEKIS